MFFTMRRLKRDSLLLSLVYLLFVSLAGAAEPLERDVYLMGTSFQVVLYESDRNKGLEDLEALVRIVEEAEDQLSTWRPESELSRLNEQPISKPFHLSPPLCALWKKLEKSVRETDDAFDPSVGSLARIWGIHDVFRIPDRNEIADAMKNVGFHNYERTACTLAKSRAVVIDVGGFGKGEAIDRAMQVAEERRMGPLLINFGGQLAVRGLPPQRDGWEAVLADAADRMKESPIKINLQKGAISTSGGNERDGEINGKRIGHILNPKTGYPVPSFGSVTVWKIEALEADILSTALYVMGPEIGYQWAEKHNVAACFQLIQDGERIVLQTPSFHSLLSD